MHGKEMMRYHVDVRRAGNVTVKIRGASHLGDVGFSQIINVTILNKSENFVNFPPEFAEDPNCPPLEVDFGATEQKGAYECQLPRI